MLELLLGHASPPPCHVQDIHMYQMCGSVTPLKWKPQVALVLAESLVPLVKWCGLFMWNRSWAPSELLDMQDLNRRDLVTEVLSWGLQCVLLGVRDVTHLVTAPVAPIKIGPINVSSKTFQPVGAVIQPQSFPLPLSRMSLKFYPLNAPSSRAPNARLPQAGGEFVV